MLNVPGASSLPISTAASSLHGVRPDPFYTASASLNASAFGLGVPSTAPHSSISPADLHMLSHCKFFYDSSFLLFVPISQKINF